MKNITTSVPALPSSHSDYELLASVLSYCRDITNFEGLAEVLLDRFANIRGVMTASMLDLDRCGLSDNEITYIKILQVIARRYYQAIFDFSWKSDDLTQHLKKLLLSEFSSLQKEILIVILLDSESQILGIELLNQGSYTFNSFRLRPLYELICKHKATSIILAHNHPKGNPECSTKDRQSTLLLEGELRKIEVALLDHLIIGKNQLFSMMNNCYI